MADRNQRGAKQADIAGTQKVLPASSLKPNPWNYNRQTPVMFKKLIAAIKRHGFTKPIIVCAIEGEEHQRMIVDGEHRWRAATALGMPTVPVVDLGVVSEERAKELTIILNELHGDPNEARLSDLLRDISGVEKVDEMLEVMPFVRSEMDAYLSTIDFGFTNLSEEDPSPETRAAAAPAPERKLSLTFTGKEARELRDLATSLGMKPGEAVLMGLRHRAAKGQPT
jgi:ParB family transcriptional regulator, chromosome partitioning protein